MQNINIAKKAQLHPRYIYHDSYNDDLPKYSELPPQLNNVKLDQIMKAEIAEHENEP